ncbi:hypothetical protein TH1_19450 [Thalassospira lucentensis MCCC 1A00383 = DSM 14000]|nr:hypothetical protein TH1_19450 [Thalassospira lucentensis MCCC 1A00383 = DSM 14000]
MFGHFVRSRASQHDSSPCKNDRKSIKTGNGMAIALVTNRSVTVFALHHRTDQHVWAYET